MMSLATEVTLLRMRCEGLEKALINEQKRHNRKKPLLLTLPDENDGGAIFFSPQKVQQARDLQFQKDQEILDAQAQKEDKKLQQRLIKEEKERLKAEKAEIRQKNQEIRQNEAAEKQRLKAEKKLARQLDLQLQNDIKSIPSTPAKQKNRFPAKFIKNEASEASERVDEPIPTINRRGRQIRLPVRFRD